MCVQIVEKNYAKIIGQYQSKKMFKILSIMIFSQEINNFNNNNTNFALISL